MMWDALLAAFFLGLLGAGHCLGMCGGIAAALSFALPAESTHKKLLYLAAYNLGRVTSYAGIGLLAGILGWWLGQWGGAHYLRILAGILLILLGLHLADWWRILVVLEKSGAGLWAKLKPISNKLLPVKSVAHAALLGLLWGWLPCGLIYSALGYALASSNQNAFVGAAMMLAFGVGTLPAVFVGGLAAAKILALFKLRSVRLLFAICYILFGCWTIFIALQHSSHSHHGEGAHHEHTEQVPQQMENQTDHHPEHHHDHHH